MSACGNCGHEDRHGRRGFGGCHHSEPTPEAVAKINAWEAEYAGKPDGKYIVLRLAETYLALPGASVRCPCVRKTSRIRAATPPTRSPR